MRLKPVHHLSGCTYTSYSVFGLITVLVLLCEVASATTKYVPPETEEAHGGPAAASWPHLGNLWRGNTQRLWWSEQDCNCCEAIGKVCQHWQDDLTYLKTFEESGRTHSSPQRTAFSTPTAAVVCLSKPWPMWSAWALVRSSNSISLGSLVLGRYCRFFISLVDLHLKQPQTVRHIIPLNHS